MVRFFVGIYDFLHCRPLLRWSSLGITVALLALASFRMTVKEDIGDFLPSDKKNQDVNWAFTHLNASNKLVVTIQSSGGSPAVSSNLLMDAVDTLEQAVLRNVPSGLIGASIFRLDPDMVDSVSGFITANLPYYLGQEDYKILDTLLAGDGIRTRLNADRSIISSPVGGIVKQVISSDPLMLSAGRLKSLEQFGTDDSFEVIDDYIFTDSGRTALVTFELAFGGSDTGRGNEFINHLDAAMAECEAAFGGEVKLDAFGSVYIAATNSGQLKRDSLLSVAIALVVIAVLLVVFFRSGRSILLVGATVAFGYLSAFGLSALIDGSISLIVIGMGAVIIGIAANYPLHYVAHIKQGYSPRDSLIDIVKPLTTGNITTVGAFLSLLFISSPAMRDLGLFAALLLAGTILFTLIFLPHLVRPSQYAGLPSWGGLSSFRFSSGKVVIPAVLAITVFLWFFNDKVHFATSLHSINYMTDSQRENMSRMLSLAQGDNELTYVAVDGATMDEALENYYETLPKIDSLVNVLPEGSSIRGVRDLIPCRKLQGERVEMWNTFISEHGDEMISEIRQSANECGFRDDAFDRFYALVSSPAEVCGFDHFSPLYSSVAAQYFIIDEGRCAVLTVIGSDTVCVDEVTDYFRGDEDVIVFNPGSITSGMVSALSSDFDTVLYICAFIVFALLCISFGRIEIAGMAFLPLTVSWIWILGLMGIFGIEFNIVNIILATFIFGMGDDYTIFITEGLMYEYAYGKKMIDTYRSTIILSALIMFVGIGSLIVAKHPAMLSLAYVTIIGMASVVLMACILPPFIFRWLTYKKGKKRDVPVTLRNWGLTFLAFIIFMAGSLFMTLAGVFLITFTFGSRRGRDEYHKLMRAVSEFIFKNVFMSSHKIDINGETFRRPAIVVANHQSHLDLMALLMLTPKIVAVTNKRVWNNPFYGILIRYAGYCPVDDFMNDDLSLLERKLKDGYSILIFPEGTRTPEGRIGRFRKGAFHLAQKYGVDILPVVLHGLYDALPKRNLLLRSSVMSVNVMDRITPDNPLFGLECRDFANNVRHIMEDKLASVASEVENADFYAERVRLSYIYKGAEIARGVRTSLKKNSNFASLADSLPERGRVLFVEPHYGEAPLIAALVRKELLIDVSFSDEMVRSLAAECAVVPSNLHHISPEDATGNYDVTVTFKDGGYSI